jgi:hypothetical protein
MGSPPVAVRRTFVFASCLEYGSFLLESLHARRKAGSALTPCQYRMRAWPARTVM